MAEMDQYLSITHLADMPPNLEGRQVGFVKGVKGESAFLNVTAAAKTVMIIELLPEVMRGGHYHVEKEEWIYMVEGEAYGYFWFPEEPDNVKVILMKKNDLLCIKPGLAHAYVGKTRALALEQAEVAFKKEHTVPLQVLPELPRADRS